MIRTTPVSADLSAELDAWMKDAPEFKAGPDSQRIHWEFVEWNRMFGIVRWDHPEKKLIESLFRDDTHSIF